MASDRAPSRGPVYEFPGVWSVYDAGTRTVVKTVEERNFKWWCEREGCGWSGDGYSSASSALDAVVEHQRSNHPKPSPDNAESEAPCDGDGCEAGRVWVSGTAWFRCTVCGE